jgi:hypothetical protein
MEFHQFDSFRERFFELGECGTVGPGGSIQKILGIRIMI